MTGHEWQYYIVLIILFIVAVIDLCVLVAKRVDLGWDCMPTGWEL